MSHGISIHYRHDVFLCLSAGSHWKLITIHCFPFSILKRIDDQYNNSWYNSPEDICTQGTLIMLPSLNICAFSNQESYKFTSALYVTVQNTISNHYLQCLTAVYCTWTKVWLINHALKGACTECQVRIGAYKFTLSPLLNVKYNVAQTYETACGLFGLE